VLPLTFRGRRLYYGWVLVGLLGITQTITWGILYYGFSVFLPAMEADRGWSRGEMSGALSLATLLAGLCAAPVGRWLDAHGARLLMSAGSVLAVLLLLAWSRVETLAQLYLVWALIGAVMALVLYEPAIAVITVWFERQRTRALTAMTLIAGFASTIFMPIESWLIEAQGWREALVILAAFLALTTILPHVLLLRRRPEDLGLRVDGEGDSPGSGQSTDPGGGQAGRAGAGQSASSPGNPTTLSVGRALRQPAFRWLALAFSLNMLVSVAVSVHLVAYLLDRGYDLGLAATATGLIGAMQVFGRIVLGLLGDRAPLRVTASIALAIQPVSLLILLVSPGALGVWAFIALFGATRGAMSLIRPGFIVDLYGRERYATIAGAVATFVMAATALAPIGAGAFYDLLGSYDPLFWSFVALSTISAGVVLMIRFDREAVTAP
jgi:MFS family permease